MAVSIVMIVFLHYAGQGTFQAPVVVPFYSMRECSITAEETADRLQAHYKADGISILCMQRKGEDA